MDHDAVVYDESTRLDDYFAAHYCTRRLTGCRPRTLERYRNVLAIFDRWHARPVRLGDLSHDLVAKYRHWLVTDGRRQNATANAHLRHLFALWSTAAAEGFCATRPPTARGDRWVTLRVPRRENQALSIEQLLALFAAAAELPRSARDRRSACWDRVGDVPGEIWYPFLLALFYSTGGRLEAVRAAKSADLDLARQTLTLRWRDQKQWADQTLRLHDFTCSLAERVDAQGRGLVRLLDDWPFDRSSRRRYPQALARRVDRIAAAAGVVLPTGRRFHAFRATVVTQIAARFGEAAAQLQAGHRSPQTTRGYIDARYVAPRYNVEALPEPPAAPPQEVRLGIFRTGAGAG